MAQAFFGGFPFVDNGNSQYGLGLVVWSVSQTPMGHMQHWEF